MSKLLARYILKLRLKLLEKIAGDLTVLINTTIFITNRIEFGSTKDGVVHCVGSCNIIGKRGGDL